MKIPKYIEKQMKKLIKASEAVTDADCTIHHWMESKGIEPNDIGTYDETAWVIANINIVFTEPNYYVDNLKKWIEEH